MFLVAVAIPSRRESAGPRRDSGSEMDLELLAASGLAGILVAWLATYLWARREIKRAARFGDRRLRSAEWAAEEYRREIDFLRTQLEEATRSVLVGSGRGASVEVARRHSLQVPSNGNGSSARDDLKRIRGIGERLESQLNGIDVTTFAQIAAWSEEDIEAVASRLRVFPGRIRRDGWVEGARRAHLEKYGTEPWRHVAEASHSVPS